jgi:hypothetical protein
MADEYELYYDWVNDLPDIVRYAAHLPPTTTAFQLRCESISHDVDDASAISPLPSFSTNNGAKANSMTPGQLINIVIGMGLRSELIKLSGVLVDEGPISASNPRKQVLMNIARLQYLKTGRSGSEDSWGGSNGGPLNPRSYTCLTIFDPNSSLVNPSYAQMDVQPAALDLSYRGIIKNLAFRQEGGRPNQWFWSMEFQVVANEHAQGSMLTSAGPEGAMQISRIRLVSVTDGETALTTGPPSDYPSRGYIEIQVVQSLTFDTGATSTQQVADYQVIKITGSDSVPPINGSWTISKVNPANRTFVLLRDPTIGNPSDVAWVDDLDAAGREISLATGKGAGGEPRGRLSGGVYVWEGFTDGSEGYVIFPPTIDPEDGTVKSGMRREDFVLPESTEVDDTSDPDYTQENP